MPSKIAPFFPTHIASSSKASIIRHNGPTEVHSNKKSSNLASKPDNKKKLNPKASKKDLLYSGRDSWSVSDESFVDDYLVDGPFFDHKMPPPRQNPQGGDRPQYERGPERDRPGNNRQEPPRGGPPRAPQRGEMHDGPDFDMDDLSHNFAGASFGNAPPFPVISIYDHIHLLRQTGASVKYTPKSRMDYTHDFMPRQHMNRRISASDCNIDVLKLSDNDVKAIDNALSNVLNTGAEVEFSSLHESQAGGGLSCNACLYTFSSQQDRDEHIRGGRITCSKCSVQLPCQTMMGEHMHKVHGQRGGQGFNSPTPFGSPNDRNDRSQWS